MLPLIVGMMVTVVKANTAAQTSIVNQQYARAQALFLTYNSPDYPNLSMVDKAFTGAGINANQMVIFVGEENTDDFDQENEIKPSAPTQAIAQNAGGSKGAPVGKLGASTGKVRVLSSVSLCTQSNTIASGGGVTPTARMTELTDFRFCSYPFIESGGTP